MSLHLKTDNIYLVPRYNIDPLIGGALIAGGTALASSAFNAFSQYKTNKQNEALTREQLDYNKQLNAELMAREDTAYQRAVADAQKAGFSPLVVSGTGGAGSGGTVSALNASPSAVAPQVEPNTFISIMQSLVQQHMQDKQLTADSVSQESKQGHETEMLQSQLSAQSDLLDKQIAAADNLKTKELAQDWKKFNKNLQFQIDSKNADYLQEMSRDMVSQAKELGVTNFEYFDDMNKYKAAITSRSSQVGEQWNRYFNYAKEDNEGYLNETVTSGATSSDSLNAGLSSSGTLGNSSSGSGVGTGANMSASSSAEENKTINRSTSAFDSASAEAVKKWNSLGMPVFVGSVTKRD